jgi:hypothetical protein
MSKKYLIEFKVPIKLISDKKIEDIMTEAAQCCDSIYGFKPSIWFADISEFDCNNEIINKYFYNPNSSTFIEKI